MQTTRKIQLILGVSLLVPLGLFLRAATARPTLPEVTAPQTKMVLTGRVQRARTAERYLLRAQVRARQRAALAFTIGGRLEVRPARIGAVVQAGALLAQLDRAPLKNNVQAALAQLQRAQARASQLQRDEARAATLVARKAGRPETLEKIRAGQSQAQAAVQAAQAQWQESKRLLREAQLRAPFSGRISAVALEPGEFAQPGRPVVSISASEGLEIEVQASERLRARLREDTPVELAFPLAPATARARIEKLGGAATGPGALFPVVIALEEPSNVYPGYSAEVSFLLPREEQLSVPLAAIVDPSGQSPYVFKLQEERARKVRVQIRELLTSSPTKGGAQVDRVAVTAKLLPDDQVIVSGHASLLDGQRVLEATR